MQHVYHVLLIVVILILTTPTASGQTNEIFTSFFGISGAVGSCRSTIDAAGSGDILMTGYTSGTMGVPNQNPALSSGSNDWFVARYNSRGDLLWFRKIGGTGNDAGFAITTDGQGNVYVGGASNGNIAAGISSNGWDPYVCKFDVNGTRISCVNVVTSSYVGGMNNAQSVASLLVDGSSLYVAVNEPSYYFSITKYDLNLNPSTPNWKFSYSAYSQSICVTDMVMDGNHNIIVSGIKNGYTIPAVVTNGIVVPAAPDNGGWDGFVMGISSSGARIMTATQGSSGDDYSQAIAVDGTNSIYVTGFVQGNYDGQIWRNYGGRPDVFITKYGGITPQGQGERLWSRVFYPVGISDQSLYLRGVKLAVDFLGGLYVVVGNQYPGPNNDIPTDSYGDYYTRYLQKLDTNGNILWGQQFVNANTKVNSLFFDNTGAMYISGFVSGLWNGLSLGQGDVVGFIQRRDNPLNCSCSELSSLVDQVTNLLQLDIQ